jgi:DNA-binding transcriptional ArsR family regulator
MKTSATHVIFISIRPSWLSSCAWEESVVSVPLYQAKAEFFKTLGHPARIRILELLSERDHAVHELLDRIEIEPSNLSQQLAVLRRTSMVVSHRRGAEVVYSVSVPEVRDLLMTARKILSGLIADQGELVAELTQSDRA